MMEKPGSTYAQASSHSHQDKSPKKRKLLAKVSESEDEENKIPLSSKFTKLKFDFPVLSGNDQGEAKAAATTLNMRVVKRRNLVKVGDVNTYSPSTSAYD